jgi:hypothetical protein
MRLPIIKGFTQFAQEKGLDTVEKAIEVLEHTSEMRGFKDEELEVVGELLSNLYGTLEVTRDIDSGTEQRQALNNFMQRVLGSIDQKQ